MVVQYLSGGGAANYHNSKVCIAIFSRFIATPHCLIMDILPSLLSLSCLICVTRGIEYRKPITNMVLDGYFDRGLSTCVSLLATDSETYKGGAHN